MAGDIVQDGSDPIISPRPFNGEISCCIARAALRIAEFNQRRHVRGSRAQFQHLLEIQPERPTAPQRIQFVVRLEINGLGGAIGKVFLSPIKNQNAVLGGNEDLRERSNVLQHSCHLRSRRRIPQYVGKSAYKVVVLGLGICRPDVKARKGVRQIIESQRECFCFLSFQKQVAPLQLVNVSETLWEGQTRKEKVVITTSCKNIDELLDLQRWLETILPRLSAIEGLGLGTNSKLQSSACC